MSHSKAGAGFSQVSVQLARDGKGDAMCMTPLIDDFERVLGLYRGWDVPMLLEEGRTYLVEDGGRTDDGQPLYFVFTRAGASRAREASRG